MLVRTIKGILPHDLKRRLRRFSNNLQYFSQSKSLSHRRSLSSLPDEFMPLRSGNRSVFFEIRNDFSLGSIRDEHGRIMIELLKSNKINFWQSFSESNKPLVFNLMIDDLTSVVDLIQQNPIFEFWYADLLDHRGRAKSPGLMATNVRKNSAVAGIRLYKRLACGRNLSFRSTSMQGVELRFWIERVSDETGAPVIAPAIWNEIVGPQPLSLVKRQSFEDLLETINSSNVNSFSEKIDVVYTWVDGSDSDWLRRKESSRSNESGASDVSDSVLNSRYKDNDELKFSLRSIYQYAPWVNKIYIVTDRQTPSWLRESEKVVIVDHSDIWPDSANLPVFNSHAIEACIHRIPELSEYFLYFNDDVLLTRPVSPSLFYYPSGISKVFWSRAQVDFAEADRNEYASTVAAKNARKILVGSGELYFTRKFFHTPAALRRSICFELESKFADSYLDTRKSKFRSIEDIAAAGSLYFNYGLSRGYSVPGSIRYDYIDPSTADGRDRMSRLLARRNFDCVVINDNSADLDIESTRNSDTYIVESLSKLLPVPAPWEY